MASIYNVSDDTLIVGTSAADFVSNYGANVTITACAGDDTVYNTTENVTIDGGTDNDSVNNYGSNISISGGDGDDTISNSSNNVTIDGSAGNDAINNSGSNVTIAGGAGNDTIDCSSLGESLTISGGKGNDSISLDYLTSDKLIKYNSGDGNDTVSGFNDTSTLQIGGGTGTYSTQVSGNDIIVTVGKGAILLSGTAHLPYININDTWVNAGKTINNTVSNKTINGTTNNDSITNSGNKVKLNGLAGNDTIFTTGDSVTIDGGDENDRLENSGAKVSIYGGDGNDNIANVGDNVTITGGEGNDSVYTHVDNVTIDGGAGNDSVNNYGSNISISGGDGDDTIDNGGERISINGGTGHDSIRGYNDYSTILGGAGNDIITGEHYRTLIYGGTGNDQISIGSHYGDSISGGDSADTIAVAGGAEHSIDGGAGNDIISLCSSYGTARGGKGDDVIYGSTATSYLYEYSFGDGDDTIYNWSSNATLTITGGSFSYKVSGNNGIVTVANSGNITLVGAKGKTVNINGKNYANATNVVTPHEVIKKFMGVLDTTEASGVNALDKAVSIASGGYFKKIQSAIDQMVADVESYNDGDKFLREKCGIILDNKDTGAITGSDAGGSVTKNASDIVPEEGDLENFTGNEFIVNGLTVKLAKIIEVLTENTTKRRIQEINYDDLSSDIEKYIWRCSKIWWIENALNLIAESYGDNYGFSSNSSAMSDTLNFGFFSKQATNGSITNAQTTPWIYSSGEQAYLSMEINLEAYPSFENGGNPDGKVSGRNKYLDRTISHELTHAVMMANIENFNDLPQFITEGMADLTHGVDDTRTAYIQNLSKADNVNYLKNSLALDDHGTGTIAVGTDYTDAYAGGYMFLRWFAKQASENYTYVNPLNSAVADKSVAQTSISAAETTTVKSSLLTLDEKFPDERLYLSDYAFSVKKVNAKALTRSIMIVGNTNANSIVTGSGNDTVFANTGKDTLDGDSGNDVLNGEAGNDLILGGDGADTLTGGTGTDTLTGGKGNDVFVHVADTDLITDYTAGEDKIKLNEGTISGLSISKSNLVIDVGAYGSITVKNGANKKITVIDANGTETVIGGTAYTNSSASKVTLASGMVLGDATTRTKAIRITGNKLDNSIVGGSGKDSLYGKDGDDYISGGKGNDTLSGGNGADTLFGENDNDSMNGGAGNDSLSGGSGNDKLLGSTGDDTLSGGAGNDTLTGGSGADLFLYTAGKDTVTDFSKDDTLQLGDGTDTYSKATSGSDVVVTVGDGSITLKDTATLSTLNILGEEFNATVTYDNSSSSKVTLGSAIEVGNATARTKAIKITGNALDNSILGGSGKDSIYGQNGNDYLRGNAGNDKLYGQNGNDYLIGDDGADYLSGGSGKDSITGGDGKDSISGGDGNDYLVGGAGADSISGGADNDSIWGGDGNDSISGGAGNDSIYGNADNDKIWGGDDNDYLRGNAGNDSIYGNDGNDKLYGDAGNDVLLGGLGNDSLWGGDGADKFFYYSGDDNDVIFGFDNNDLLHISGTFSATYNSSKKTVAFKVDSTSSAITLKEFTATTFHVNTDTYIINSSKKFVKR